jgi:hypothetical protein
LLKFAPIHIHSTPGFALSGGLRKTFAGSLAFCAWLKAAIHRMIRSINPALYNFIIMDVFVKSLV